MVNKFSLLAEITATGIVKTLHGHPGEIRCINISADGILLTSGSIDSTARKLVAGSFEPAWVGAVRFSHDSKKLMECGLHRGVGCPSTEIGSKRKGTGWVKHEMTRIECLRS